MPKLTIDNQPVEVPQGATILDAAEKLGIEIPTMCFMKSCTPSTSCMVCVVKVNNANSLVPSCGTKAVDGMKVQSQTPEISQARKAAVELLLSDHIGDCMGPCHVTCPAKMNIPLMIRQIAENDMPGAIKTVKKDIAIPAVLGRICPAPCENACRRKQHDSPVSICLLKRIAADTDLESKTPFVPQCDPSRNKTVAVIGSGPVGLTAAYYLQESGFDCIVYDRNEKVGGMLRKEPADKLPAEVLDSEIKMVEKLGVNFKLQTEIQDSDITKLQNEYDAVLLATGIGRQQGFDTSSPAIFDASDPNGKPKTAVLATAAGKDACAKIIQYFDDLEITGSPKPFNSRMGKLKEGEIDIFMSAAKKTTRKEPQKKGDGLTQKQAIEESLRCLHCDCRKPDNCKLRKYAEQYLAKANTYKGERRNFIWYIDHPEIIVEPGKCIDCGLCIQITAKNRDALGLAFSGRGFDVNVKVPFDKSLVEAFGDAAGECVKACPTGAISWK